jgi:phosphate uptake regulator
MEGKIWVSGRNYVTSFPDEWGEMIKKEYNSQVRRLQIGSKIIITPPFDPFKKREIEIKVDPSNKAELKMKVVSAYLQGYDLVRLRSSSLFSEDVIEYLREKTVPDLIGELSLDGLSYEIMFATPLGIPIPEILDEVKNVFQQLKEYTSKSFEIFPKIEYKQNISVLEKETDKIYYRVMRYLNKALLYADIFKKTDLKDDRAIIHLQTAFTYLERLGDLHKEIIDQLEEISNLQPNLNLEPFLTYFNHASQTIPIAIDALIDARKGTQIIQEKLSDWPSYKEEKDKIASFICSQDDSRLVRKLSNLEGKLYAIPDLASNICEQAWNKEREL